MLGFDIYSANSISARHFYRHSNDVTIRANVDSGASVDIIDKNTFQKVTGQSNIKLIRSKIKLFPYATKTPLDIKNLDIKISKSRYQRLF